MRYILALLLLQYVYSYKHYQDRIPNGDKVSNPCKPGTVWKGVGHLNPQGGGERNPFGVDFARVKTWSRELCMLDSDGDGKSNGEELGDPGCVWTKGLLPQRTLNITHPGICDPWSTSQCSEHNSWVKCQTSEFVCDSIHHPDVMNLTLRFPVTTVPTAETTYICMTYDLVMLDPGVDYHLIGIEPLTDNEDIMHHTDLYTCSAFSDEKTEPTLCTMTEPGCGDLLSTWVLGLPGHCLNSQAGFRLNSNSRLMMQHHWNNPELRSDYTDSSGLILYLTKNLRTYDAGFFVTGQSRLEIPPGQTSVPHSSHCTPECTEKIIKKPIYFMTGLNHMHYMGRSQSVEHFRNGEKLRDLTRDDHYSYDSPVVYEYDTPIEVRPGDDLLTTCVYSSTSKTKTLYYGESTNEEMCFSFFTFFPLQNVVKSGCTTWDDIDMCTWDGGEIMGCNVFSFLNASSSYHLDVATKVLSNCNVLGGCRQECIGAVSQAVEHPCLVGKMRAMVEDFGKNQMDPKIVNFFKALESCDCPNKDYAPPDHYPNSGNVVRMRTLLWLISVMAIGVSCLNVKRN